MKRFLLTAAIVAATLSSCSKNEIDYNLETADNAISFGVYTGINTKAAVTDTDAIQADGFYLFGFYTDENTWANTTTKTSPNFMYNQLVNYYDGSTGTAPTGVTGAGWYYSPVKYWSEDYEDYYSFFAYAPEVVNEEIGTLSLNTDTGVPSITFSLSNLSDMVDFVADVQMDVQSGKTTNAITGSTAEATTDVTFNLLHETTRVGITALTNITTSGSDKTETATHVIVKELKFTNAAPFYTKATYTFAQEKDSTDPVRGTWTSASAATGTLDISGMLNKNNAQYGKTSVDPYDANQGVNVINGKTTATDLLSTDFSHIFLIPASASSTTSTTTSTETATLQVTYDIITLDSALEKGYALTEDNVATVTIPSGLFTQGTAYNLQLTFYLNEVVLEAEVTDWSDPTSSTSVTTVSENSDSGYTVLAD